MTKREKIENILQNVRTRSIQPFTDAVDLILAAEDDPPEPEIKPGELVKGWTRSGGAFIGTLLRQNSANQWVIDTGDGREFWVGPIERFYMPFDWERWPSVEWVVDFDSTERFALDSSRCPWELGQKNRFGAGVVRILKRPEGK